MSFQTSTFAFIVLMDMAKVAGAKNFSIAAEEGHKN
jgi:hypothetical protein